MNRILITLAAVIMAMVLGACGQKEPKPPEVTTPDAAMDQPKQQEEMPAPVPGGPKENDQVVPQTPEEGKADVSASASDANANPAAAAETGVSEDADDDDDDDDDDDEEE